MSAEMLETISPRSTHDAAVQFAHYGWSVFPCKPDKRPYTAHGFHDASRDERQIDAWWRQWPDALIGIACGASGLVVLDYDPDKDPEGWGLAALEDLIGETETREARTGRGGKHFYFRANPETPVRNSASDLAPGLDVRADGGYVIAPPSISEHGEYTWLNRATPVPITPAIIEAATEPAKKPRESAGVSAAEQGTIPDGQRNVTLASIAGTLWRRGLSPLAVEAALVIEDQEHCKPPLGEEQARQIARNIVKLEGGNPYEGPAPPDASEPTVELLETDSVRVGVLLSDGAWATFTFTEMEKDRRELASHLSLTFFGAAAPYQQRLNLDSSSQRTELRRELDNLYGKDHGWGHALNTVLPMARASFLGQDRSTPLSEIPLLVGARDLIPPIMPAEGVTILFGDGSSSKSYIALALGIAGVTQVPAAGRYAVPGADVLYIDYEDSATNFRRRAGRVLNGLGLSAREGDRLRYWKAQGAPLRDQWDAIKRCCDRNGIGWIIVDSAAPACGGPPEESQAALGFFNAIDRIGRPAITVAHITKGTGPEATQKPFGSAFWHNLARRTWFVARAQEDEADEMHVALYCRKVNDGPRPRPIGLHVTFEGDEGPVTLEPSDPGATHELAQYASVASRIWSVLDTPRTAADIAEIADLDHGVVRVTLRRKKEKFIEIPQPPTTGKAGRPAALWARRASLEEGELF